MEDMSDYLMPSLRRKPSEIILHVGTNNLKSSEPIEIVNLGFKKIQNHCPDIKVIISSLILRFEKSLDSKNPGGE